MRYVCLTLLFFVSMQFISAQRTAEIHYQYKIDKYFDKPGLRYHLDTLLQNQLPELKDAKVCSNCLSDYVIEIGVMDMKVYNTSYAVKSNRVPDFGSKTMQVYEFSTPYQYQSFLILKNSNDSILLGLRLVDSSEVFYSKYLKSFEAYNAIPANMPSAKVKPLVDLPAIAPMAPPNYGPENFMSDPKNENLFIPKPRDIYVLIYDRLMSISKIDL